MRRDYSRGGAKPRLRARIAGIGLSLFSVTAWAQTCPELSVDERGRLDTVHDGDTLRLTDGRRVRLLTINAPELATDGNTAQPLARASREAVEAFFAETKDVYLSYESRRTDRYGRVLAHVIQPSGRNLERYLVRRGLALPVPVPPDLDFATCLAAEAERARAANRGLWEVDYWQPLPATALEGVEPAFRRVCGRLSRVDRAGSVWLEMEGDLVLRIAEGDLSHFRGSDVDPADADDWRGRRLQARGWLRDRSEREDLMARGFKPWVLQVRTPYALRWLDAGERCGR